MQMVALALEVEIFVSAPEQAKHCLSAKPLLGPNQRGGAGGRQHSFNFVVWSNWESHSDSEKNIRRTRDCWSAMKPFLISSTYGNHVSDEGEAICSFWAF